MVSTHFLEMGKNRIDSVIFTDDRATTKAIVAELVVLEDREDERRPWSKMEH